MKKLKNVVIGFVVIVILGSLATGNNEKNEKDANTNDEIAIVIEKDNPKSIDDEESATANEESSNSNTDTPKVVEEVIALDIASNTELMTELVNSINYNDAYNEYQKRLGIRFSDS